MYKFIKLAYLLANVLLLAGLWPAGSIGEYRRALRFTSFGVLILWAATLLQSTIPAIPELIVALAMGGLVARYTTSAAPPEDEVPPGLSLVLIGLAGLSVLLTSVALYWTQQMERSLLPNAFKLLNAGLATWGGGASLGMGLVVLMGAGSRYSERRSLNTLGWGLLVVSAMALITLLLLAPEYYSTILVLAVASIASGIIISLSCAQDKVRRMLATATLLTGGGLACLGIAQQVEVLVVLGSVSAGMGLFKITGYR